MKKHAMIVGCIGLSLGFLPTVVPAAERTTNVSTARAEAQRPERRNRAQARPVKVRAAPVQSSTVQRGAPPSAQVAEQARTQPVEAAAVCPDMSVIATMRALVETEAEREFVAARAAAEAEFAEARVAATREIAAARAEAEQQVAAAMARAETERASTDLVRQQAAETEGRADAAIARAEAAEGEVRRLLQAREQRGVLARWLSGEP